jgi:hypothetical protein
MYRSGLLLTNANTFSPPSTQWILAEEPLQSRPRPHRFDRLAAVGGVGDLIFAVEDRMEDFADSRVVVDDKYDGLSRRPKLEAGAHGASDITWAVRLVKTL